MSDGPDLLELSTRRSSLLADVGAACAILVAICSLGMTIYEARAVREHDRIAVWPRLAQSVSDSAHLYIRTVTNAGLGPAIVRTFGVSVDGVPKHDWGEVLNALRANGSLTPSSTPSFYYSALGKGSVLLPGSHLDLLTLSSDTLASTLVRAEHRVRSTVCYCSVYQECWLASSDVPDPEPVSHCDESSRGAFGM